MKSPRDRVLATFDATAEWMRTIGPRGCAMVNACAEVPDPGHAVHQTAAEQKAWLRGLYLELVNEAGYDNAEVMADRLLILHEGAVVIFSVAGMTDALDTARDTAALLLP